MKKILIYFLIVGFFSCHTKQTYQVEIDSIVHTEDISRSSTIESDTCFPCCEECPIEKMQEQSIVMHDTINIMYVLMEGFADKDCCIYGFGELINNRPFADKYKEQHIFLLDVKELDIGKKSKALLPTKNLEQFVIAHVYMSTTEWKLTWDPYNTGKYSEFKKYKNL